MTKHRTLLLLFLAIILGTGAAMGANRWLQSQLNGGNEQTTANTTPIVVAAVEIPFGYKIESAQLKTVAWPNDNLPHGAFNDPESVAGMISRQAIYPDEVVLKARVAEHSVGSTLAAIIDPEKRAVTVRVNDVVGVAGFLLPGNRVDVLASDKRGRGKVNAKTILENLKVLAVDQSASPEKDKPVIVRAVTLEMSPKEGEKLFQATQQGSIQLALRNPLAKPTKKVESKPAPRKVVRVARSRRYAPTTQKVTVIRGMSSNTSTVRN